MFKDAKVGDKVWSINYGWGSITTLYNLSLDECPVELWYPDYKNGSSDRMTICGRNDLEELNPSVFWDEVKITLLPKPKKEVVVEWYQNMYQAVDGPYLASPYFSTRDEADSALTQNTERKRLGEAVHIKHTYMEVT